VDELERLVADERLESVVLVLVDEEKAESTVRLTRQRIEEAPELDNAINSCDDQVVRARHGPYASAVSLVSVLLAVHDDARFIRAAVDSILGQSLTDWELIVVDDASTDDTPRLLDTVSDRRLRVVRNQEQAGLAASLNRGLEEAEGRFVARFDADDVALPNRLERQVEALRTSAAGVLGSAIRDLDERGHEGRLHRMPLGARALRWHALFSSPFFHPTVVVDREALGELRYDTSYH
jgi:glycosyltransferase involved in cell wall biosynthesis